MKTQDRKGIVLFKTKYFQAPNFIFDEGIDVHAWIYNKKKFETRKMKAHEKLIYLYLCRLGNQGGTAFPSYSKIAKTCCCSRKTAIVTIQVLERNNYIKKVSRNTHTNVYYVLEKS